MLYGLSVIFFCKLFESLKKKCSLILSTFINTQVVKVMGGYREGFCFCLFVCLFVFVFVLAKHFFFF